MEGIGSRGVETREPGSRFDAPPMDNQPVPLKTRYAGENGSLSECQ
jgi:hypothetical protein